MGWGLGCVAALAVCAGAALAIESWCEAQDRAAYPPPGRMVDIGGRRLHLLCKGTGPTVVIEQGAGSPSILWWPIQDQAAAFAQTCLYDRAGYQWSDPAPGPRSVDDRVQDLHTLLHMAGLPAPYVLVGHSFAGPLLRRFFSLYPAEVAGLVLIDTTPDNVIFRQGFRDYANKLVWFARAAGIAARFGVLRVAVSFMRTAPDGVSPDGFRALKSFLSAPGFFRAMADDPAALARLDQTPQPAHAFGGRPVIVITHEKPFPGPAAVLEQGWPEGQAALAALSTRGVLETATGCNHMIPSEAPALVVEAIRRVVAAIRTQ